MKKYLYLNNLYIKLIHLKYLIKLQFKKKKIKPKII